MPFIPDESTTPGFEPTEGFIPDVAPVQQKQGFFKTLGRTLIEPGLVTLARPVQAIQSLFTGKTPEYKIPTPFGSVNVPDPYLESQPIKRQLGRSAQVIGLGLGPVAGGAAFAGGAAAEEGRSVPQIATSAGVGALTGKALELAGGAIQKYGPKLFKSSAEKSYAKAIGATTKANKAEAEKVIPGLIERGVVSPTRESLKVKAEQGLEVAGQALDDALSKVPKNAPVNPDPIIKSLEKAKRAFVVEGTNVVADEGAVNNISLLQEKIRELGENVSYQSLRSLRQIWDKGVVAGGKNFGRTIAEDSKLYAQRNAANAIRGELAKKFPDVAKVNAEYSFWSTVDDLIGQTLQRTKPQGRSLTRTVAEAAIAGGGLAGGGTFGHSIFAGAAIGLLHDLVTSTGWRTVSAVTKSRIANLLAKRSFTPLLDLLNRVGQQTVQKRARFQ